MGYKPIHKLQMRQLADTNHSNQSMDRASRANGTLKVYHLALNFFCLPHQFCASFYGRNISVIEQLYVSSLASMA